MTQTYRVKPEWFDCEQCLWFMQASIEDKTWNACTFEPEGCSVTLPYKCSRWTCARCWGSWAMLAPLQVRDIYPVMLINHNLCTPVTFQEEENP